MKTTKHHRPWALYVALIGISLTLLGFTPGYQGEVHADPGDHPHCGDTLDGTVKMDHTLEHDLTDCSGTLFLTNGANLDLNGYTIRCNRIVRCIGIQHKGSDLFNGSADFSGNTVIQVGGTGSHHVYDVIVPSSVHNGMVVSSDINQITEYK